MNVSSVLSKPSCGSQWEPVVHPAYVQNTVVVGRGSRKFRAPRLMDDCPVRIGNCSVVNMVQPKQVTVYLRLESLAAKAVHGHVRLTVVDPASGQVLTSVAVAILLGRGESRVVRCVLHVASAEMWTLANQTLYTLHASWHTRQALHPVEAREVLFGFFEFPVEGTGRDTMFRRSNRQARLAAAMGWGFWGEQGLTAINELVSRRPVKV